MSFASGPATDWTNGTGVFPAGGVITVLANTERQWFYVQNRDLGEVTVAYATQYANGLGSSTEIISLNPASASGNGGGTEERGTLTFLPEGQIVITGTAGQKVAILTG